MNKILLIITLSLCVFLPTKKMYGQTNVQVVTVGNATFFVYPDNKDYQVVQNLLVRYLTTVSKTKTSPKGCLLEITRNGNGVDVWFNKSIWDKYGVPETELFVAGNGTGAIGIRASCKTLKVRDEITKEQLIKFLQEGL